MKNYYAILEVPVGCSVAEIRQAYRRLVQENADNAGVFADLNEAHEVLTTPARRADYDRAVWGETFAEGSGAAAALGGAGGVTALPGASMPGGSLPVVLDPLLSPGSAGRCPMGTEAQCPVLLGRVERAETYCPDCGYLLAALSAAEGFEAVGAAEADENFRLEEPSGRVHRLQPGANLVGRESADVLLPDKTVSRRHALLEVSEDGRLTLEDMGSTNGTQVGSDTLVPHIPRTLQAGDRIRFGSVVAVLHPPAQEQDLAHMTKPGLGGQESAAGGAHAYSFEPDGLDQRQGGHGPARAQVVETREEGGRTYPLMPGVTTFGRRPENSVVLLGDPYVSGSHAQIVTDGEVYRLTDVGSTNGTLLNGERLAINEPQTLSPEDVILIGGTALRFELLDAAQAPENVTESVTEETAEETAEVTIPEQTPAEPRERTAAEYDVPDDDPERQPVTEAAPAPDGRTPESQTPDFPMQDSPTNVER